MKILISTVALSLGLASMGVFYVEAQFVKEASKDKKEARVTAKFYEKSTWKDSANYLEARPLNHIVSAVKVFSDQAEVTRSVKSLIKKGTHWYSFLGLNNDLLRETIRIETSEKSTVKIVQIIIEKSFEKKPLPKKISQKVSKLRGLYYDLVGKQQLLARSGKNLKFLQSLDFKPPFTKQSKGNEFRAFAANIGSLRAAMRSVNSAIVKEEQYYRNTGHAINDLNNKIDVLEKELNAVATRSNQVWLNNVFVLLESPRSAQTRVALKYRIPKAWWYPTYDVRAQLDRKNGVADLNLIVGGTVEQHTGESWEDVTMTLSSLDPVPLYSPIFPKWVFAERRVEAPMDQGEGLSVDSVPISESQDIRKNEIQGVGSKKLVQAKRRQLFERKRVYKSQVKKERAKSYRPKESREAGFAADEIMAEEDSFEEEIADSPVPPPPSVVKMVSRGGESLAHFPLKALEHLFPQFKTVQDSVRSDLKKSIRRERYHVTSRASQYFPPSYNDSMLPASQAQGRKVEFTSPFHGDLNSDEPPVKIPLQSQKLKGKLSYLAIPKKDKRVFLRAEAINHSDWPILAGKAQVFMDGDLISKTRLHTIDEGGYFAVDLGVDPNVKTKRVVTKKSEESGLINKDHTTRVTINIEVSNTHPFPLKFVLKDNYPLSNSEKVSIKMGEVIPKTKPSKSGIIIWNTEVAPKTVKKFSFSYEVNHPSNFIVSEFN